MPGPRLKAARTLPAEGGWTSGNHAANQAAPLQKVVYRTNRPEIPFSEKIVITKKVHNQWLTRRR
jgi:hypothetical protein